MNLATKPARIARIASLWGKQYCLFQVFISDQNINACQSIDKNKRTDIYTILSIFSEKICKKWEWRWKSDIRMNLCHFSHESIGVCASKPASPIRGCNRAVRAPSKRTICPIPVEFHLFVHSSIRMGAIIWDAGEIIM